MWKKVQRKEAELQRSIKNAKELLGALEFGSPPSYRDKLMAEILGAFAQAFNLGINDVEWGN